MIRDLLAEGPAIGPPSDPGLRRHTRSGHAPRARDLAERGADQGPRSRLTAILPALQRARTSWPAHAGGR